MESPDNPELVPESSQIAADSNGEKKTKPDIQQAETVLNGADNSGTAAAAEPANVTHNETEALREPANPPPIISHAGSGDSAFGDPAAIWPDYCNPNYVMPDQIDVKVTVGGDTYFFPVAIEKANPSSEGGRKLYLGGYRNKLSGAIYHHAATQTPSDRQTAQRDMSNLRTRDTQTSETRTLSVQPGREAGTQMERVDLRLDNKRDTIRYPKPYFTSDELLAKQRECTICIQRNWRGCMARGQAQQIRQRNIDFARQQEEERERVLAAAREERVLAMARRTHPKSNEDFAALFNELDVWRRGEVAKIKANVTDPEERKQAMAELLLNETKALQGIQKLKVGARKEMQVEKTQQMLQSMAKPHQWQLSRGETALVHTPETQRAQELLQLYAALTEEPMPATEQRLDVLLNVKWTVRELQQQALEEEQQQYETGSMAKASSSSAKWAAQTQELMDLVDREADLLERGRPARSMESLRLRIANLFLLFIENPTFNPRAADFLREKEGTA